MHIHSTYTHSHIYTRSRFSDRSYGHKLEFSHPVCPHRALHLQGQLDKASQQRRYFCVMHAVSMFQMMLCSGAQKPGVFPEEIISDQNSQHPLSHSSCKNASRKFRLHSIAYSIALFPTNESKITLSTQVHLFICSSFPASFITSDGAHVANGDELRNCQAQKVPVGGLERQYKEGTYLACG